MVEIITSALYSSISLSNLFTRAFFNGIVSCRTAPYLRTEKKPPSAPAPQRQLKYVPLVEYGRRRGV